MNSIDIAKIFGPGGYLSNHLRYEYRPQQIRLANAIMAGGYLMSEAGTGSGKSLSYLVPSIDRSYSSDTPVVIATGTIALQEQLKEEIEKLRGLWPSLQVTVLKGRSNYICPYKLEQFKGSVVKKIKKMFTMEKINVDQQRIIAKISNLYENGLTEKSQMPNDVLSAWDKVDAHSCFYCKMWCPLKQKRKEAKQSHIILVNHALLMINAMTGSGILPEFDSVIIDEAHHIEDAATSIQSFQISTEDLNVFGHVGKYISTETLPTSFSSLISCALNAADTNGTIIQNGSWSIACAKYGKIKGSLYSILDKLENTSVPYFQMSDYTEAVNLLKSLVHKSEIMFNGDTSWIRWKDKQLLKASPLKVDEWLLKSLWKNVDNASLLSATLTKLGEFDRETIGLPDGPNLILDSPFNFKEQVLLAVPNTKDIDDPLYLIDVANVVHDLYTVFGGSVMCLFTSYRAMREVDSILRNQINVLTQGIDGERNQLIEQFKKGGSVLLGTNTFWEGIDLVGDKLKGLVIARLPFDVPTDPLHAARAALYKNPFIEYSLPRTSLKLRQGFGRLIRSKSDKGVVVIMDPRFRTKSYGKKLLNSLPSCNVYYGDEIGKMVKEWME